MYQSYDVYTTDLIAVIVVMKQLVRWLTEMFAKLVCICAYFIELLS